MEQLDRIVARQNFAGKLLLVLVTADGLASDLSGIGMGATFFAFSRR
ncbi:MAG: hypothetical protein OXD42_05365 [Rhodospirillaceae bacterium]|nr:hypothetical protein [Rhodospirillaceae bacterium]